MIDTIDYYAMYEAIMCEYVATHTMHFGSQENVHNVRALAHRKTMKFLFRLALWMHMLDASDERKSDLRFWEQTETCKHRKSTNSDVYEL